MQRHGQIEMREEIGGGFLLGYLQSIGQVSTQEQQLHMEI
jgi:hypothetical protein